MGTYSHIPENNGLFQTPVVTIGSFDGVHLGHQKILSRVLTTARSLNADPVVITFSTHPRKILKPEQAPAILTTAEEKIEAIRSFGIDNIIILDFTHEIAAMSADEFYGTMLIERLKASHLIVGYDHAFGKDREGNFEYLQKIAGRTGVEVTRVREEDIRGKAISSSWLRYLIEEGDMTTARSLLGRDYSITARVVSGEGRGRLLGFPTANCEPLSTDKLIPGGGVFVVQVTLPDGSRRDGMCNIGTNPTFEGKEKSIEVHLFNCDGNLYDAEITIHFCTRLRDEIRFSGPEDLIGQLEIDRDRSMEILEKRRQ